MPRPPIRSPHPPPRRRSRRSRPTLRRIPVGRLGLTGPRVHALIRANGEVFGLVVERSASAFSIH